MIYEIENSIINEFETKFNNSVLPSYIYTYPLRQSYRPILEYLDDEVFIETTLNKTPDNFNLYIHFPFCKQICSFCNLFAVVGDINSFDDYINLIEKELDYYSNLLTVSKIRTVYLGGGTPSLMNAKQIERVLNLIDKKFPNYRDYCDEICLEVDPSTINYEKALALKNMGINRMNLGIQTFSKSELDGIGRRYIPKVCEDAIISIKKAGVPNLSVDLINGLLNQTDESWVESLKHTLSFNPETICLYHLVVRPTTGFYKIKDNLMKSEKTYHRYDLGYELLMKKGYLQETNVRFALPKIGGYKQIEYHWEGATVLGIGAGARTYATDIHYVNGYSSKNRKKVFKQYCDNIKNKSHSRALGYHMTKEEQIRREFVLNLHRFDIKIFEKKHAVKFHSYFNDYISYLDSEKFINVTNDKISFSPKGFKYRDLISSFFISDNVCRLFEDYNYMS